MDQHTTSPAQPTPDHPEDDELDLFALWENLKQVFIQDWKTILGVTVAVAVLSAALTYTMTPMYKATVVVQVKGKTSKGGGSSALMDLAAAAGMPVLADETADAAIGKLKSAAFARNFIDKEKLVEHLTMPKAVFFSLPKFGETSVPNDGISEEARNLEKARKVFAERVQITVDNKTQLLTLVLTWEDPLNAAALANKFVRNVNDYMRQQAIENAQKSVAFLTNEVSRTSLVPVQQAIFRLMEEQVKTQMTAGVSEEFALRFIDPASPPIQRDSPKRRLIVSMATLLGFVLTLGVLFIRRHSRRREN
jgi:uncharacterized protein involved in exopolysaccharide biosynthesis